MTNHIVQFGEELMQLFHDRYHTVTPYLIVANGQKVIDFLIDVFDAEIALEPKFRPDNSMMHVEMRIGDSIIMMSERMEGFKLMPAAFYVYVNDCDAVFARAIEQGSKSICEPEVMQNGDRYGYLEDPFGNQWAIASTIQS